MYQQMFICVFFLFLYFWKLQQGFTGVLRCGRVRTHIPTGDRRMKQNVPVCDFSKMYLFSLRNHLTVFSVTFSASAHEFSFGYFVLAMVQLLSLGHTRCLITFHFMITFPCTDILN